MYQISVKSVKADNIYSGYCGHPKNFSFKSLLTTSNVKLKFFGVTSQKLL